MTEIQPKKHLSQNFLRDEEILEKIACEAKLSGTILEIGPGEGVLTEHLARRAERIIAIEFDRDLLPGLQRRFPDSKRVQIIQGDFLALDISLLMRKEGSFSLFGNIPYAITGKIIRKIIEQEPVPETILLLQKEVADRIAKTNGKGSLLALAVELVGTAAYKFTVSRNAFFPIPKVDSALVHITPHSEPLSKEIRTRVLRLARIAFAGRRKTLTNTLAAGLHREKKEIHDLLNQIHINPLARPESLNINEWLALERTFDQSEITTRTTP